MARVWYHGGPEITDWEHLRWDRERGTADGNAEGAGMYWTTDEEEAATYGPFLYGATTRPNFRQLPNRRPTLVQLRALYELAEESDQQVFVSNWQVEDWPPTRRQVDETLMHYWHQTSLFDACVTLYHDLFRYDAETYVAAMRIFWDGHVVKRGTTGGSRRRDHLVVWNPRALIVTEVS